MRLFSIVVLAAVFSLFAMAVANPPHTPPASAACWRCDPTPTMTPVGSTMTPTPFITSTPTNTPSPTSTPIGSFVENWSTGWQTRWQPMPGDSSTCSQSVNGKLVMDCQSAALISNESFSNNSTITLQANVLASYGGIVDKDRLASLTIFQNDDGQGCQYGGIYMEQISPTQDRMHVIASCAVWNGPTVPHGTHTLKVVWTGSTYRYYLDGVLRRTSSLGALTSPAHAWVGCAAVGPGEPNAAIAMHCETGVVTVN